VYIHTS